MIIPAIIPKSLDNLKESLELVSFASAVQIDLVDGIFVLFESWPYNPAGDIHDAMGLISNQEIEVDLMVDNQIDVANEWLNIGAKRIIFHLEGLSEPQSALLLKKEDNEIAFSIKNDTPLDELYLYIDRLDFVQLMGIAEIGQQGQPFDSRVLDRIAILRSLYPNLIISVDGGVNKDTIKLLKVAGANRFVAGSAILASQNPKNTYKELCRLVE